MSSGGNSFVNDPAPEACYLTAYLAAFSGLPID